MEQRQRREERVDVHVERVAPLHVRPVRVPPQVLVANVPGIIGQYFLNYLYVHVIKSQARFVCRRLPAIPNMSRARLGTMLYISKLSVRGL